jgi:hypothetical protein
VNQKDMNIWDVAHVTSPGTQRIPDIFPEKNCHVRAVNTRVRKSDMRPIAKGCPLEKTFNIYSVKISCA